MSVAYKWINEPQRGLPIGLVDGYYDNPDLVDFLLNVTGRLVVTDIDSPLRNGGLGLSSATGRLIDFSMGWSHQFEGSLNISPVHCAPLECFDYSRGEDYLPAGDYERGSGFWGYDFWFTPEIAFGNAYVSSGDLTQPHLFGDHVYVLLDDYYACCNEAGVFGHWERDWTVPEPSTVTMLGFTLVALAIVRKMRRFL
jgi:hypothetical protein